MNDISLNFVPLRNQNQKQTIYRKQVSDTLQPKKDNDFRVKLPEVESEKEWIDFDISTNKKERYEAYEYEFTKNPFVTNHLIYQKFLTILGNSKATNIKYEIPEKKIKMKEVHFVIESFDEGNTEIIVSPYYLKEKRLFGFIVNHKFNKKDNYPFNRRVQILSYSLDKSEKSNVYFYKDKKAEIEKFIHTTLFPLLSNSNLEINTELSTLPTQRLGVKTYLVGNEKTSKSQFMGIKRNGPYRCTDKNIRYFFLFSERNKSLARDIYSGLVGTLFPEQFPGLEKMFSLPIQKDIVSHLSIDTFDENTIKHTKEHINKLKLSHPEDKIMLIAILPKGFKNVDSAFDAYGHLKLISLQNNIFCQVITEDTFFNQTPLKWSISNIGLQIFSKLGGTPWLVEPAKNKCLILGIGSVRETDKDNKQTKYTAYTVCLDSSGNFKYIKPLSSSENETTYLGNLEKNLNRVLGDELEEQYKSLVLHLPYKISRKEIDIIKRVVDEIRGQNKIEVIAIRINTKHKFLGFSSHNTSVPYESTYVQLSKNEFLVWTEGLQYGKEVLHKRTSEPLYINFIKPGDQTWATRKDCLQDILNLTGANWRGFNAKAQPISIFYSHIIAEFMKEFSHFKNMIDINIVSAESKAPWFL